MRIKQRQSGHSDSAKQLSGVVIEMVKRTMNELP